MTKSTKPTDQHPPSPSAPLSVVGLGASAGGLAALQTFFDAIPSDTGMTFVVVTHLSPDHESILPELLQSHTAMPVTQVAGPTPMARDHVYVIPSGKRLVVMADQLDLADSAMPRGQRLQIDSFFQSLAEHHGDGAAVILSGMGSDGAVGVQRIKERGGLILVQEPTEAEFDGMPRSTIATGLVDVIAPVAALVDQLVAAKQTRARLALAVDPTDLSPAATETLAQLLNHLHHKSGHDFSGYRRGPLLQRIARRMQLAGEETLSGYLQQLRGDAAAVDLLFHDLVTHVTEFFHDPAAWAQLETRVIPQLFAGKGPNDSVRVWTIGCANGEEAYGVGMLLLEHAATLDRPPQIQIFASDLGKVALEFARAGLYPAAIAAHVSEERLERFFEYSSHHYCVRKALRDHVIFAEHNLLRDPPFARLDLIICRNLLPYLQPAIQAEVYTTFHYALQQAPEPGHLFLGSHDLRAGAPIQGEKEEPNPAALFHGKDAPFVPIEPAGQIYQRSRQAHRAVRQASRDVNSTAQVHNRLRTAVDGPGPPGPNDTSRLDVIHGAMHRQLLEEAAPPSLLVDKAFQVLHLSATVGRYLRVPGGELTSNITHLVRPELQFGLRAALTQAFADSRKVHTQPVPVQFDGALQPVSLFIQPNPQAGQALVFFFEGDATQMVRLALTQDMVPPGSAAMDEEAAAATLVYLKRKLAALQDEYETMMAELHAVNAELQSEGEEHTIVVEELEASKEELQSVNEELEIVNTELQGKVEAGMSRTPIWRISLRLRKLPRSFWIGSCALSATRPTPSSSLI